MCLFLPYWCCPSFHLHKPFDLEMSKNKSIFYFVQGLIAITWWFAIKNPRRKLIFDLKQNCLENFNGIHAENLNNSSRKICDSHNAKATLDWPILCFSVPIFAFFDDIHLYIHILCVCIFFFCVWINPLFQQIDKSKIIDRKLSIGLEKRKSRTFRQ